MLILLLCAAFAAPARMQAQAGSAAETPPANLTSPEPAANAVPQYTLPQYNPQGSTPQNSAPGSPQRGAQQTNPPASQRGVPQREPQGNLQGSAQTNPQGNGQYMPGSVPANATQPATQTPKQGIPQAVPQSTPQQIPQAIPQSIPQSIPQAVPQGEPGTPESAAPSNLPGAMATRSKLPTASDYDEVHLKPQVHSEEKAKFDPHSTAAVEAGVDPKLRTRTKPIRVDVEMVLVPVTVTDPSGRPILGLNQNDFVVLDNGVRQSIESFSCEDAPVSIGVLLDTSGSMHGKIDKARDAIIEFLKTSNPEDEFFLISFADRPLLTGDFTTSVDEMQNRLLYSVAKGRTALLDAIYLGVAKMRHASHRRKALLIVSDGGDNRSKYSEGDIRSLVREADVQIYAMGIFDVDPRSHEEEFGPMLLSDITEVTGGRTYAIENVKDLSDVATKISLELRNQYVLGYTPSDPGRDGKWRKVRVRLSAPQGLPPLSVYAKMGYYAPNE